MTVINKSVSVPYSSVQMFELVNNIESYPDFLPWCKSTTIHSASPLEVKASIQVAKGGIAHSFTTLNQLVFPERIQVQLVEGPFQHLKGHWHFEAQPHGGCLVGFYIDFEFKSKLVSKMLSPLLQSVADTFIEAFIAQARKNYGG